jgi:hypothetical protein
MTQSSGESAQVPKWPTKVPSAADLLTYYAGRGLWLGAAAWGFIPAKPGSHGFTRYMAITIEMIDCHDKYLLLRTLADLDPMKADELAEQMWRAADAGDSYGELLWEWAEDRGLEAEAIHAHGKGAGEDQAANLLGSTEATDGR